MKDTGLSNLHCEGNAYGLKKRREKEKVNMPGIAQISEKLADEALGLADEHYKHSKVGSLLERVKGLVTSPNANDNLITWT